MGPAQRNVPFKVPQESWAVRGADNSSPQDTSSKLLNIGTPLHSDFPAKTNAQAVRREILRQFWAFLNKSE